MRRRGTMRGGRATALSLAVAVALVGCTQASLDDEAAADGTAMATATPQSSASPRGTPSAAPEAAVGPLDPRLRDHPAVTDEGRDPLLWPYPADSIWNRPLGDAADLVPLDMELPSDRTLNIEEDILVLSPESSLRPIREHDGGWRDGVTRCDEQTGRLVHVGVPFPTGFMTDPDFHGSKPNHSAAVVLPDLTLFETQPLHVCADGTVVSQYANERRQGDSLLTGGHGPPAGGSHGGSGMTAFGGTIRLGEWVPGGTIPHTLKIVVDSRPNLAAVDGGYRWPAARADRDWASTYRGDVPAARMGSLLALPPDFPVSDLTTEPARILAEALVGHGAYVVDETGWSTAAFAVEWSPTGRVRDEFREVWGFDMVGDARTAAGPQADFLADVERIYAALHVVDDNGPDNIGGAGERLAPTAPPLRGSP